MVGAQTVAANQTNCAYDVRTLRTCGYWVCYLVTTEAQDGIHRKYIATNWDGSLRIDLRAIEHKPGKGGFGADRIDVWFDFEGVRWHGINRGDNQILHCYRLKNQPRKRCIDTCGRYATTPEGRCRSCYRSFHNGGQV